MVIKTHSITRDFVQEITDDFGTYTITGEVEQTPPNIEDNGYDSGSHIYFNINKITIVVNEEDVDILPQLTKEQIDYLTGWVNLRDIF